MNEQRNTPQFIWDKTLVVQVVESDPEAGNIFYDLPVSPLEKKREENQAQA